MRKGFELAFSTAYLKSDIRGEGGGKFRQSLILHIYLFGKSLPFFFAMDDVTFYKPVEIGDILSLEGTVTYTSRRDFSKIASAHFSSPKVDMVKNVVETSNQTRQTFINVRFILFRNALTIALGRSRCFCLES